MKSKKTYLSNQIRLISLTTTDLFTNEEYTVYQQIIDCMNNEERAKTGTKDPTLADRIRKEKKELQNKLSELVALHEHVPRTVRLSAVLDSRSEEQRGITWWNLKPSRRIAEFASEESRALELKPLDITFDKIIFKWKSMDILRQIVLNGFYVPILLDNGTVENRHFRFMTASAGQLRTDKIQCISDRAWDKIHDQLECGLDWTKINAHGGVNTNKYLAYLALPCGATEEWSLDIDRCIVIDDFEDDVTGIVEYIKPNYTSEIGVKTIRINHVDGAGMMLPKACGHFENNRWHYPCGMNFMVRAPWIKGLVSVFDYVRFIEAHGCSYVIKDIWGQEHDIIKEDIWVIFTKSQLKMWKYYQSWTEYKTYFKQCHCHFCRTNYEEDYAEDTGINYQMLQTLTDFPDELIEQFVAPTREKIKNIAKDKSTMLRVLKANEDEHDPYRRALSLYDPLLRDAYARETIKSTKKRWLYDAKSGAIKCKNKRLFAIPDWYAACEHWFKGEEHPKGLLAANEIACKTYLSYDEAACLRSPHLSMEWSIHKISKDPKVYEWFKTNGVYTSTHSLVSKVLQFDVDGDMLNVVVDRLLIDVAKKISKNTMSSPFIMRWGKPKPTNSIQWKCIEDLNEHTTFRGLASSRIPLRNCGRKRIRTVMYRDCCVITTTLSSMRQRQALSKAMTSIRK